MFSWRRAGGRLEFEGELEISAVESLQGVLLEESKGGRPLEVDLSGLTKLDTAAAQVIVSLIKSGGLKSLALSPPARAAFKSLGLGGRIEPFVSQEPRP